MTPRPDQDCRLESVAGAASLRDTVRWLGIPFCHPPKRENEKENEERERFQIASGWALRGKGLPLVFERSKWRSEWPADASGEVARSC
jgi:hypothetical protein